MCPHLLACHEGHSRGLGSYQPARHWPTCFLLRKPRADLAVGPVITPLPSTPCDRPRCVAAWQQGWGPRKGAGHRSPRCPLPGAACQLRGYGQPGVLLREARYGIRGMCSLLTGVQAEIRPTTTSGPPGLKSGHSHFWDPQVEMLMSPSSGTQPQQRCRHALTSGGLQAELLMPPSSGVQPRPKCRHTLTSGAPRTKCRHPTTSGGPQAEMQACPPFSGSAHSPAGHCRAPTPSPGSRMGWARLRAG